MALTSAAKAEVLSEFFDMAEAISFQRAQMIQAIRVESLFRAAGAYLSG
jgi:hypothetical protein